MILEGKNIKIIIDVLVNSMEYMDETQFADYMNDEFGWDQDLSIEVFNSYWDLGAKDRMNWSDKDWTKWLNKRGIKESHTSIKEESMFKTRKFVHIKAFEQFMIKEEDTSRSDGYVPGYLSFEWEGMPEGTELAIDALGYPQAGNDDLVVCFLNSEDEDLLRVPKSKLELEQGEGI